MSSASLSLALLVLLQTTHAVVVGNQSVISSPGGGTPATPGTTIGDDSNRRIIIQAKNAAGANDATTGLSWAVEFFTSSSSCDTWAASPTCTVSCSPFLSPNTAAPACLSSTRSYTKPQDADAHWADATNGVTDNGDGTYTVVVYPEVVGTYDASVALLTQGGLRAWYYDNGWFQGSYSQTRVDTAINFNWGTGTLTTHAQDYVTVRWEGKLKPVYSETYDISVWADDGARVWIDRVLVIDAWSECCNETWASVALTADKLHDIIVEYHEAASDATMELRWRSPSTARAVIPSTALYYRDHISGSPFVNIVISPGDPPSHLTSYVPDLAALDLVTVDAAEPITMQAQDIFANDLEQDTSMSDMSITVVDAASSAVTSSIAYSAPGKYVFTFTATVKGDYNVSVMISGVPIVGFPRAILIVPAATHSPSSVAAGAGISTATAGTTAYFTVQPKDAQGNLRIQGGDVYAIQMTGSSALSGACEWNTATVIYDCWYTPTGTGSSQLAVFLNGVQIASSPFTVTIAPAPVFTGTSTLQTTAANMAIKETGVVTFDIITKDRFGNVAADSGVAFSVEVPGTPSPGLATNTSYSAGVYSFSVTVENAGDYLVWATISGVNILNSPFEMTVGPSDPSATYSTHTAPVSYVSGVETTFKINSVDAYQNDLATGASTDWTVSLVISGVTVAGTVTYVSGNEYTVVITPTKSGTGTLTMTIGAGFTTTGTSLSSVSVTVFTGDAYGSTSTLAGGGLTACVAGAVCTFTATTKDENSNSLSGGGSRVTSNMTKHLQTTGIVDVADQLDGTFILTRTITVAGDWDTEVYVREKAGGLLATYYDDQILANSFTTQTDETVNFAWAFAAPLANMPADYFSIKWTGEMLVPYDGTYTFYTAINSYNGVRLYINSQLVVDQWDPLQGVAEPNGDIALLANTYYRVELQFQEVTGQAGIVWSWSHASVPKQVVPKEYLYAVKPVASSPYTTAVTPAATDPTKSTYSENSWLKESTVPQFISGTPFVFRVQARDAYDNAQSAAGVAAAFNITLAGPSSSPATTDAGSVTDFGQELDGLCDVTLTPTIKGTRLLNIEYVISGVSYPIAGSPVTVNVLPGEVSVAHSVVSGLQSAAPIAGQALSFTIQAKDANDNALETDASITAPKIWTITGLTDPYTMVYTGAGIHQVTFTENLIGAYTVGVLYDGNALTTSGSVSPFSITATATTCDAVETTVSGGMSAASQNVAKTETILPEDKYGNAITVSGSRPMLFYIVLTGPSSEKYQASTAASGGNYEFTYTSSTTGSFTANVQLATGTAAAGSGLTGYYYNNRWLSGDYEFARVDPTVNFDWTTDLISTSAKDYVSVRWTGFVLPTFTSAYTFSVDVDDGCRLYIDNVLIIDQWDSSASTYSASHTFAVADELYPIKLEFRENTNTAKAILQWANTGGSLVTEVIPQTNLFAAATDVTGSPFTITIS